MNDALVQQEISIPESKKFIDRIPVDILFNSNSRFEQKLDVDVYVYLRNKAKEQSEKVLKLPKLDDMCFELGISHQQYLSQSLKRLHKTGWVTITNLDQRRSEPFRVMVTYSEQTLTLNVSEEIRTTELMTEEKLLSIIKKSINDTLASQGKTIDSLGDCPIILIM